jgi:CheY-like chemotaxis protein
MIAGAGVQPFKASPVLSIWQRRSPFPRVDEVVTSPSLRSADPRAKRACVLLIDDEPVLLRGLKRSLSGHTVMTVTRVDEALALYQKHDFDIVFCDLMMPESNGIEFYSRLRQLGPEHAQRLVLMTGGALPDRLGYSVAEIPSTCLLKPFSSEQVEQLIEQALERRR